MLTIKSRLSVLNPSTSKLFDLRRRCKMAGFDRSRFMLGTISSRQGKDEICAWEIIELSWSTNPVVRFVAQEKMRSIFVYFQCLHALRLQDHMQRVVSNGFDGKKWKWDETPPNKLKLLHVFFCSCILRPVLNPSQSLQYWLFLITIYCNSITKNIKKHIAIPAAWFGWTQGRFEVHSVQSFEVSKPPVVRRWQMFLWDPVDCTSVFRELSVFRSFVTKGVQFVRLWKSLKQLWKGQICLRLCATWMSSHHALCFKQQ